jgi:hypothetical protein
MKFIILALLSLIPFSALAEIARIHSITPTFIKFEDGRVGFLDEIETEVLEELKPGHLVTFEIDQENTLENIKINSSVQSVAETSIQVVDENYSPSVLPDYDYATRLLHTFRYPPLKDAQCYDKAMIWTYEAEYFYRARLLKSWLFFSDHYIESYRYKWWFHVAPLAKVNMRGKVEERILDREFFQHPLRMKLWTDLFMKNKATCKEITSYTDYSKHPDEDDCYVLRSTPFYWQPRDLEALAERGTPKMQYLRGDLIWAYKYGFNLRAD